MSKECQRAVKVSSFSWVGKTSLGWQQRKAFSRCFANKWDANRTFRNIDMICIFHLTNLPLSLTWTWHAKRKWKQIYSWRCALCTENLKYILGIWLCFTYAACPYARGHPGAKTTKHRKLKATNENNKLGSTKKTTNARTENADQSTHHPTNQTANFNGSFLLQRTITSSQALRGSAGVFFARVWSFSPQISKYTFPCELPIQVCL